MTIDFLSFNTWISKWNLPDDNLDYFVVAIIKLFADQSKQDNTSKSQKGLDCSPFNSLSTY